MLIGAKYSLRISSIVDLSMDQFDIKESAAREKMQADVSEFLRLRLKNVFDEAGIRYDVADAVMENVDDIYGVYLRAQAVAGALQAGGMTPVIQAFVRAGNIAAKAVPGEIDETLFAVEEEKSLYDVFNRTQSAVDACSAGLDYAGALEKLKALAAPIDALFDKVMVMDKDERIRNNRLSLLKAIDCLIRQVADFSRIVLEK